MIDLLLGCRDDEVDLGRAGAGGRRVGRLLERDFAHKCFYL